MAYNQLIAVMQPFAIALAVGLLIGVERERSHPPGSQPLGLRSFVLLSLLGTIAAQIAQPMIAVALTAFVGGAVIAGYIRSSTRRKEHPDVGITTEIAAVVTYGLGYLAAQNAFLALLLGVIVLIVLMARKRLHRFSRQQLRPEELRATIAILIIAIGVIPFLPDQVIDHWGLFNPQRFMFIVLFIALLQFGAYVGIRLFGRMRGILLTGFLSGFVSSTATTVNFINLVKEGKAYALSAAIGLTLATAAMFLEAWVIIYLLSPKLANFAIFMVLPTALLTIAVGLWAMQQSQKLEKSNPIEETEKQEVHENPLSLIAAIKLALVLFLSVILITIVQRTIGNTAFSIFCFLSGLVQTRGVVLAITALYIHGSINKLVAINGLGLTLLASFISKFVLLGVFDRSRFFFIASGLQLAVLILFSISWGWLIYYIPR